MRSCGSACSDIVSSVRKLLLLVPLLFVAACAPAQGVPPTLYNATSSDILAAVSQACPSIQPSGGYNYFSVTSITPTSVTCAAEQTTGMQVLSAFGGVSSNIASITFTALQNGNVTSVAGGGLRAGREIVLKVFAILDGKFQRIGN